jgi:hypothetical protein
MHAPINLGNPLSLAHWCGHFSCSERDLLDAIRVTHSTDVGTVGLYLATQFEWEDLEPTPATGSVCSVY